MSKQGFFIDLGPILEDQCNSEVAGEIHLEDIQITSQSDSTDNHEGHTLTLSISNDEGDTLLHTVLSEASPSIWQLEGHNSVQWSTKSTFLRLHLSFTSPDDNPVLLGDVFMFNEDSELLSKAKEKQKFSSIFSAEPHSGYTDNSKQVQIFGMECSLSWDAKPTEDSSGAKEDTQRNEIRASILNEVGHILHHRSLNASDLHHAILAYRSAAKLAIDTPFRHKYLLDLVFASLTLSKSTPQPSTDVDQKISFIQNLQQQMANIDWHSLALELHRAKEATEDLGELTDMISRCMHFVSTHDRLSAVKNTATVRFQLHNLGYCLHRRFLLAGDQADCEAAIPFLERAISLSEESNSDELPDMLADLATSLTSRFEHTKRLSDLEEAVSTLRRSVSLTPAGNQNQPRLLNNLGELMWYRFELTGNLKDAEEAIHAQTSGSPVAVAQNFD